MKMPIIFVLLLSRTHRAFSWDQKADGTKRMHKCLKRHNGGDNVTKVRRRSTSRNSFRDLFLQDPFAHLLKHAYGFQVLLKKHPPKHFDFRAFCNSSSKLWNALPQTVREADSSATFRRRLKSHPFSDWLSFSVSAGLTVHLNFSRSSQDFFFLYVSI